MANEAAPAYRTLITNKSRRLRVIGVMLVVAAVSMAIYGGIVIMPSLRVAKNAALIYPLDSRAPDAIHAKRVVKAQLIFAYGYWSVCGILITATLFTAWLDVREMSRSYLEQRKIIWANVAEKEKIAPDA